MLRLRGGIVAGLALSPPQFPHAGRWNSASQDRLHFHELRIRQRKQRDRDLVWINVTANPTAEWIAHQITEAFPRDNVPQYLIRDRDRNHGTIVARRLRLTECKSSIAIMFAQHGNERDEAALTAWEAWCMLHA
jgi:hypothetical protein